MKHLRIYEELEEDRVVVGDYIVLLYPDRTDIDYGFVAGGLYKVISKFTNNDYPYKIMSSNYIDTNVKRHQFRKASDEEVAMFKYNL